MSKIVISNAVGVTDDGRHLLHFPSRWSYTMTPPENYTWYPYELAYLSSLLKRDTAHQVKFLDPNLKLWDCKKTIEEISAEEPDYLVLETATLTYRSDLHMGLALKKRFGTKLIFTGAHATAFPEQVKADGVDHVCLGEYEGTVLAILKGAEPSTIAGLYPNPPGPPLDINDLPFPEDDDVSRFDYAYPPLECSPPNQVEVFASRGCPFQCVFCVCANLYYQKPKWRPRAVESVIEELKYLKHKYPRLEAIFFDEEIHNANPKFILELCQAIVREGLNDLKYQAMCGVWTLTREMLRAMKAAGYYKIRFGIEAVDESVLKSLNKRLNIDKVTEAMVIAKEEGILTYGTFTFGAPGATRETDEATVEYIRRLLDEELLWEFQTSICTPQPGTAFYKQSQEEGWLIETDPERFDGATKAVVSYPHYPAASIEEVYCKAYEIMSDNFTKRNLQTKGPVKVFLSSLKRRGIGVTARITLGYLRRRFRDYLPGHQKT